MLVILEILQHLKCGLKIDITTFEMWFKDCCLFSDYNIGGLLPFILKAVVEILEISSDSGTRISNVKDVPCRTIFTSKLGRVIGFGNFMKDEFVFADDLIKLAKEELEEFYKDIV